MSYLRYSLLRTLTPLLPLKLFLISEAGRIAESLKFHLPSQLLKSIFVFRNNQNKVQECLKGYLELKWLTKVNGM